MTSIILVIALAQTPAEEPLKKQCVEGKPTHCAQELKAGEPAPFDGQLYTPDLAIDQAQKAHSFDLRLKLELDKINADHAIAIRSLERDREIDAEAAKMREDILRRAIDEAEPPFYAEPAFVIPVTAILVTGVIFGAIALSAELGQAAWAQ